MVVDQYGKKLTLILYLHPKINSRWIIDLTVKGKIIQLLEVNNIFITWGRQRVPKQDTKNTKCKVEDENWTLLKLRTSIYQKYH